MRIRFTRAAAILASVLLASGAGAAAASAAPARLVPVLTTCAGRTATEPAQYTLACGDGGAGVKDVRWTSWTPAGATGRGTYYANACVPDCAAGHYRFTPVAIRLGGAVLIAGEPRFTDVTIAAPGIDGFYEVSQYGPVWAPSSVIVCGGPGPDAPWERPASISTEFNSNGTPAPRVSVRDLRWKSWGVFNAYGTGLFEGQDGRLAPATVTLSAPAGVYAPEPAYFTQMAVSISGMAGHSELSWAETAASCWRPVTP